MNRRRFLQALAVAIAAPVAVARAVSAPKPKPVRILKVKEITGIALVKSNDPYCGIEFATESTWGTIPRIPTIP